MTFSTPYAPLTVVPQVGQNGCDPQLFRRNPRATTAATSIIFASLDLIEKPPPGIPLEFSAPWRGSRSCEGLLGFQALERASNPVRSMADLLCPRAVLQTLLEDVVVLWRSADRARLLQAIDAHVGLESHPVVQIPVHAETEFVGVPVKRGQVLRREHVVEEYAGFIPLNPGVAEGHFPSSPSATAGARQV